VFSHVLILISGAN